MEYQAEMLAISKAGHDKGKQYVVLGQEDGNFLLADGTIRLLEKPKKKNQKHVQLIRHIPEEAVQRMQRIRDDADIRKILQIWRTKDCSDSECRESKASIPE